MKSICEKSSFPAHQQLFKLVQFVVFMAQLVDPATGSLIHNFTGGNSPLTEHNKSNSFSMEFNDSKLAAVIPPPGYQVEQRIHKLPILSADDKDILSINLQKQQLGLPIRILDRDQYKAGKGLLQHLMGGMNHSSDPKVTTETPMQKPDANINRPWIQSATTTARPTYDQIPRPVLFESYDSDIDSFNER